MNSGLRHLEPDESAGIQVEHVRPEVMRESLLVEIDNASILRITLRNARKVPRWRIH